MGDFLNFKKMFTPIFIQVLFWVGIFVSVLTGFIMISDGISDNGAFMVFMGLGYLLLGPIIVRVYCEILVVVFSINDTLTNIKNGLANKVSEGGDGSE